MSTYISTDSSNPVAAYPTTYSTYSEAVERVVEASLVGCDGYPDDYDIDAIAAEVLGDYSQGYAQIVDEDGFWAAVARHDRTQQS